MSASAERDALRKAGDDMADDITLNFGSLLGYELMHLDAWRELRKGQP
jgi:hypothetical protein